MNSIRYPMYAEQRRKKVDDQLRSHDIVDARVLEAMAAVPREEFAPEEVRR